MSDPTLATICFRPCGCWFFVCAHDAELLRDIRRAVGDAAVMGGSSVTVPIDAVRDRLRGVPNRCDQCAAKEAATGAFSGARMLELRQKTKMSLRKLAPTVGSSAATLSRIEVGKSVPSVDLAIRLADALGVELCELLGTPNDD